VIVVAALIGLVGFLRTLERFEARHFWAFICLAMALVGFAAVLYWSGNHLGNLVGPKLHDLEMSSSP
jgi:hypothetical protein